MKKSDFVSLIMGIVGILLFGFGMCCWLVPEFNAPTAGTVLGVIGIVIILAMLIVRRRMQGKAPVTLNKKAVLAVLIGVVGALLFGLGFCLCVVFTGYFMFGIISAIVGIALLLCLIPFYGKLE